MKGRGKLEQRRWISKEKGEKWNKGFVRPEKLYQKGGNKKGSEG